MNTPTELEARSLSRTRRNKNLVGIGLIGMFCVAIGGRLNGLPGWASAGPLAAYIAFGLVYMLWFIRCPRCGHRYMYETFRTMVEPDKCSKCSLDLGAR
jgi:hypothetical protein